MENIYPMGNPLHFIGECKGTACAHCSRCGLGPQVRLTYRYSAGSTAELPSYTNGLCPTCASEAF